VEVRFHSFLTSTVEGGEWSLSFPSRFTPGERSSVHTEQDAGWAAEVVWTFGEEKKSLVLTGNRNPDVPTVHHINAT